MAKTDDWRNIYTPKKVSYFDAKVSIRCHMAIAKEIRDKLGPGSTRSELFRSTCFGPWLDVRCTSNDSHLVNLILQTQYLPSGNQNALFFLVGGWELRFGPEEFCLITGLRFVPLNQTHHWRQGMTNMTFRERVFGNVRAGLQVWDLKNVFSQFLDQSSDLDAVRLCLLMLLEVGFMGCESKSLVDLSLLQLVEDLDSWNAFPWGSYAWKATYEQLHDALAKRSARLTCIPTTQQFRYLLHGFIWAFKIWIFEVFPYARKFAVRRDGIPRAISWDYNQRITWELALPFVMDATVPGLEPLRVLTPTPAECATDWLRDSHRFFLGLANDSSPLPKKARLSSVPLPQVKFTTRP
ncbi:hypothetical protein E3N88_23136 [Mikania micrantha]|uniref:DUF1985 domain-containing protein n=1 Tax=Mikania micrantha TaxID=192012 RepID=A0A5N6NF29_9ASTR|nr:hypothetical protein E3N88_23136 [Mikania micrantha]